MTRARETVENAAAAWADLPALVRLYVRSVSIGLGLGGAFTALLICLDIGHLRHLVSANAGGWVAVVMLTVFHAALFAGVQFAIAVMRMAENDPPRGGLRQHALRAVPVRVRAQARR